MVWQMSYRPVPDSYPSADILEGNTGVLELVDPTPDGGTGILSSRSFAGRRATPESVPRTIRWNGKRKLLDYETSFRQTVSDRFRALIEEIEPGVHQFEPIRFVAKDGTELATRWFWQVCNRIDSVHRELTTLMLHSGVVWGPAPGIKPVVVFDLRAIGKAHFWHDKHSSAGLFVSNDAKNQMESVRISGVHFVHDDQA